jgi:tripartite-type tricarboxylate transporter receptor subunit TctC
VPWPAGGSTDQVMRALAQATEKYLGQPIIVENKAGAGGTLGATALVNAKPDGYTVTQLPITIFRMPHTTKVGFDRSRTSPTSSACRATRSASSCAPIRRGRPGRS